MAHRNHLEHYPSFSLLDACLLVCLFFCKNMINMSHSNVSFSFLPFTSWFFVFVVLPYFFLDFSTTYLQNCKILAYLEEIPSEWKYMDIFIPGCSLPTYIEFCHDWIYPIFEWTYWKKRILLGLGQVSPLTWTFHTVSSRIRLLTYEGLKMYS